MMLNELQPYAVPAAFVAFLAWRALRFAGVKRKLPALRQAGARIVDVRSPQEFAAGANPESVNIPLGELQRRLGELDRDKPVIVCCASGTRSAMAGSILRKNGFKKVVNAGPWSNTL